MSGATAASARLVAGDDGTMSATPRRQLDPQALGCHIDRLYRAARFMCRSPEEAEDLVQETFARVLVKPRMLRSDDDLGYLLIVLRNTCATRGRQAARRVQTVHVSEPEDWIEDRSSPAPEKRLELVEVFRAVAALPDIFREALVAVDVVGLSYREAADKLGICEATLTTRLHRARHRVARQLDV